MTDQILNGLLFLDLEDSERGRVRGPVANGYFLVEIFCRDLTKREVAHMQLMGLEELSALQFFDPDADFDDFVPPPKADALTNDPGAGC